MFEALISMVFLTYAKEPPRTGDLTSMNDIYLTVKKVESLQQTNQCLLK